MRVRTSPEDCVKLEAEILRLIEGGLCTTGQLVNRLRVKQKTISWYLTGLSNAGLVHSIPNLDKSLPRVRRLWLAGEGTGNVARHIPGETPQRIQSQAAEDNHQRDPLVAALFGPTLNAPRCIACHAVEGTEHADDCRVARFL